jgi:hypothetical protein
MTRAHLAIVAVTALAAGCTSLVGPTRPAFPDFQTIGEVASVSEGAADTTYSLSNGQVWKRQNGQFRVAYDMSGDRTLFIAGQDQQGAYILLVGSQQGLPDDCTYALRYGGREWGDAVESQGFVWRKSGAFEVAPPMPALGGDYPGNTVFCLDEAAEVASFFEASADPSSAPQQSATAP